MKSAVETLASQIASSKSTTNNGSRNSALSAFTDTLLELREFTEDLAKISRNISFASFCNATLRKSLERDMKKFNSDLEKHLSALGLSVRIESEEMRRREEFEAILLSNKANFDAIIFGMKESKQDTVELKEDIERYI